MEQAIGAMVRNGYLREVVDGRYQVMPIVGVVYGIDEMGCINNGNMPLKQLAPLLYKIFGVESKDCYRFYTDIKRRKNESRTYFLDRMQEKLNEKMLRDEEMERLRK